MILDFFVYCEIVYDVFASGFLRSHHFTSFMSDFVNGYFVRIDSVLGELVAVASY